jgi:hypothetical protein
MKSFQCALIAIVCTCSGVYQSGAQIRPSQQKSIISTKTVLLSYDKQTDTLRIPVVADQYPALKKALSDKNIFDGDDLQAVVKNYQSCGCGIIGLNYEVTFESDAIISIILYFDTMAAYPDDYQKYLTFNIKTGDVYPISKEISAKGLKWVFDSYKSTVRKRIFRDKDGNPDEDIDEFNELKTTIDSLDSKELFGKYIFTKKGIMLSTERILPHVVQAFEPDRDLLIPYDKLKIYKAATAVVIK